jgi:hypothetical protein
MPDGSPLDKTPLLSPVTGPLGTVAEEGPRGLPGEVQDVREA